MKFGTTITLQYNTFFSPFSANQWKETIAWGKKSNLDDFDSCLSYYRDLDVGKLGNKLDAYAISCSTISTRQVIGVQNILLLHDESQAYQAQQRLKQHID